MMVSRLALVLVSLLMIAPAYAQIQARIGDVTTLKGQSVNILIGTGLVTGLSGTGDGGGYAPAMRALAQMMGRQAAPVETLDELKDADNVAIVSLEVVVPETGAREGDRLDVHVTSIGAAKSLRGGRLLVTPLIYHQSHVDGVFANCRGRLRIPDSETETTAVIANGATMEQDVLFSFLASGSELLTLFGNSWIEPSLQYITLVIDGPHAGWALASEIANTIDTELSLVADVEHVAMAADPRNIIVLVPEEQTPAQWISEIQTLSLLMPEGRARVTIDRLSGTIVVSGNATISPVIVSQKGLTINVLNPEPRPDPLTPTLETQRFIPIDPGTEREARVSNLLIALNRLQVPIDDRIAILSEISRMGRLHAELLFSE